GTGRLVGAAVGHGEHELVGLAGDGVGELRVDDAHVGLGLGRQAKQAGGGGREREERSESTT
ncbi:MAG: hypothetical protein RL385_1830, partial [Pseudomonadota bacterium]